MSGVLPDMGWPNTMSEAEYEALPAGVAQRIEVVHAYVIVCESPTPQHHGIGRSTPIPKQIRRIVTSS